MLSQTLSFHYLYCLCFFVCWVWVVVDLITLLPFLFTHETPFSTVYQVLQNKTKGVVETTGTSKPKEASGVTFHLKKKRNLM